MRIAILTLSTLLICALSATVVSAAPSLPITKSPLGENLLYTGPANDPFALQGQWFKTVDGTETTVSTHEFHDNIQSYGGGWDNHLSILGYANNVDKHSEQLDLPPWVYEWIEAFDIEVTITNDTPATPAWLEGANSHDEVMDPRNQYDGTLYDVKLSTEFAIDIDALTQWDPTGEKRASDPYFEVLPQIQAVNHDELAWYCWSPDNDQSLEPGEFLVPTWDFGDIAPGESAHRTLSFLGTVESSDSLFNLLLDSQAYDSDLLFNRSTSLKISQWQDGWAFDTGVDYPDFPLGGSNVSVFHVLPEPGTMVMLLSLALAGVFTHSLRRKQ